MFHEMTHEWWGNKITAEDWADFWIHEGIGTYSEALYLLEKTGMSGYHEHMANKKKQIQNDSPILTNRPATSSETYSSDVYYKGGYFMHSLRYALGDSLFFQTIYQFANDSSFTYENCAKTQDYLDLVNKNSKHDYSPFFKMFLETTELPNVIMDSVGLDKWNVSIPNINFDLPIDLEINGQINRKYIGKTPILIESGSRIIVDPQKWYLLAGDFTE